MSFSWPKVQDPSVSLWIRQRHNPTARVSLREMADYAARYTCQQAVIASVANRLLNNADGYLLQRASPSALDAVQEETALGRRLLLDLDEYIEDLCASGFGTCVRLLIGAFPHQIVESRVLHFDPKNYRFTTLGLLQEAARLLLAAVPLTPELEAAIKSVHEADALDEDEDSSDPTNQPFYRFLETLSDEPRIREIQQTFLRALTGRDKE